MNRIGIIQVHMFICISTYYQKSLFRSLQRVKKGVLHVFTNQMLLYDLNVGLYTRKRNMKNIFHGKNIGLMVLDFANHKIKKKEQYLSFRKASPRQRDCKL